MVNFWGNIFGGLLVHQWGGFPAQAGQNGPGGKTLSALIGWALQQPTKSFCSNCKIRIAECAEHVRASAEIFFFAKGQKSSDHKTFSR